MMRCRDGQVKSAQVELARPFTKQDEDLHDAGLRLYISVPVYDLRFHPYMVTEIYDRNTGLCNTVVYVYQALIRSPQLSIWET
jgi:hypothetical protein